MVRPMRQMCLQSSPGRLPEGGIFASLVQFLNLQVADVDTR